MDLLELIKCYNMEHKSLFTAFMILLPVLFTILYLYVPAFQGMELYVQAIFSATASIFCVYFSYLFVVIAHLAAGIRYKPGYLFLLPVILIASFILIFFPENYNFGYRYVINVFFFVHIFIYGALTLSALFIRFLKFALFAFYHSNKQVGKHKTKTQASEDNNK